MKCSEAFQRRFQEAFVKKQGDGGGALGAFHELDQRGQKQCLALERAQFRSQKRKEAREGKRGVALRAFVRGKSFGGQIGRGREGRWLEGTASRKDIQQVANQDLI